MKTGVYLPGHSVSLPSRGAEHGKVARSAGVGCPLICLSPPRLSFLFSNFLNILLSLFTWYLASKSSKGEGCNVKSPFKSLHHILSCPVAWSKSCGQAQVQDVKQQALPLDEKKGKVTFKWGCIKYWLIGGHLCNPPHSPALVQINLSANSNLSASH